MLMIVNLIRDRRKYKVDSLNSKDQKPIIKISNLFFAVKSMKRVEEIKARRQARFIKNRYVRNLYSANC